MYWAITHLSSHGFILGIMLNPISPRESCFSRRNRITFWEFIIIKFIEWITETKDTEWFLIPWYEMGMLTGNGCSLQDFIWPCRSFSLQVNTSLQIRTFFCSGTVSPKCCVHSTWETITPDRKSLMKPLNKSKVCDFIKSCLCVYFSSRGPGHPCLKELCFKLFPFEFLSFGFYSFYFQPSCISNKFKRPFLFCDSDYNNFHSSSISAYI